MTPYFTRPLLATGALIPGVLALLLAISAQAAPNAPQDKTAPQDKPAMMMDHHDGAAMSDMSDMPGMSDMPKECQQMMMKMMMKMHQKMHNGGKGMSQGGHDMSAMKDGKAMNGEPMDGKAMNEMHEKCMSAMKQMHEGDKGEDGTSQMPPKHTHKKNAH